MGIQYRENVKLCWLEPLGTGSVRAFPIDGSSSAK